MSAYRHHAMIVTTMTLPLLGPKGPAQPVRAIPAGFEAAMTVEFGAEMWRLSTLIW